MSGWELREGDSLEGMRALPAASVDAAVTSPPYPDQRTYASGETDPGHPRERPTNESRRARRDAVEAWPDWFEPFLAELGRVLSPRGSAMVNLGVIVRDGCETDYADETLRRARAGGWRLLHRIVWHKPNAAPPSAQALMLIRHEYVFWLSRSARPYRGYVDSEPDYDPGSRQAYKEYGLERLARGSFTRRVGDERYGRRGVGNPVHEDGARPATVQTHSVGVRRGLHHPAPMALSLAEQLVRVCCPPGGLVLDPFAGSCTTGVAALRAGRRFLGWELRPLYHREGVERLQRWHSEPRWTAPPLDPGGAEHPTLFES